MPLSLDVTAPTWTACVTIIAKTTKQYLYRALPARPEVVRVLPTALVPLAVPAPARRGEELRPTKQHPRLPVSPRWN